MDTKVVPLLTTLMRAIARNGNVSPCCCAHGGTALMQPVARLALARNGDNAPHPGLGAFPSVVSALQVCPVARWPVPTDWLGSRPVSGSNGPKRPKDFLRVAGCRPGTVIKGA